MDISRRRFALIGLAMLGVLAAIVVYYATYWGPWAFSDGVGYIVNARNLFLGRGLGLISPSGEFEPLVSHPPLLPAMLAALSLITHDLLLSARLLDMVTAALFVFSVGFLYYRITRTAVSALTLAVLLLITPSLLLAYTSAMAEPLFLLGCFSGLMMLVVYIQSPRRPLLLGSGALMAVALLSRFPALAFVACGLLLLLLFQKAPWKDRLASSSLWVAITGFPTLAFVLYSRLARTDQLPRAFTPELDLIPKLGSFTRQLATVIWSWKPVGGETIKVTRHLLRSLSPAEWIVCGLFFALVIALLLKLTSRLSDFRSQAGHKSNLRMLNLAMLLAIICYLLFYLVVYTFSYPTPDVDWRTMLPLVPAGLILLIGLTQLGLERWGSREVFGWITFIVLGVLYGGSIIFSIDIATGLHRTGLGYTGKVWRESELLTAIGNLPRSVPWISNEPMAVLLYYDIWPYEISELSEGTPSPITLQYGLGEDSSQRAFREERGVLILFSSIDNQLEEVYGDDAQDRLDSMINGLLTTFELNDGKLFSYPLQESP